MKKVFIYSAAVALAALTAGCSHIPAVFAFGKQVTGYLVDFAEVNKEAAQEYLKSDGTGNDANPDEKEK